MLYCFVELKDLSLVVLVFEHISDLVNYVHSICKCQLYFHRPIKIDYINIILETKVNERCRLLK